MHKALYLVVNMWNSWVVGSAEEAGEITTNEVFLENNKILYKDHLFSGRARLGRVRRGHNNRNACKSRMGFKPCVKIC